METQEPKRADGPDERQDPPRHASRQKVFATAALGVRETNDREEIPASVAALREPSPTGPFAEPTMVAGEYRIIQRLGAGGMGVVYLAERLREGTRVALKLLLPQYVHDEMLCARLRREAQAVKMVQHDNVVQMIDAGEDPVYGPYVAFEHLLGQSLSQRLDVMGKLPVETALRVMDGILAALAAAHDAGVVHRDLKPDNVFLVPGITEHGDACEHVKVLDFGISRILYDGLSEDQKLTRTGVVMGTPVYMSPEQALGKPTQDHRVDVYAAGVLLYEMLSGALPHEGENYNQVLAHALSSEPISLVRRGAHIDPDLADLVHKAIAREPVDRYPSAAALRDALASWARGSLVAIPRTTMKPQLTGPFGVIVDAGARPEAVTLDAPRTETAVFPMPIANSVDAVEGASPEVHLPVTSPTPAVRIQPLDAADAIRQTLPASPWRRRWIAPAAVIASAMLALTTAVLVTSSPAESANDLTAGAMIQNSLAPTVLAATTRAAATVTPSKHSTNHAADGVPSTSHYRGRTVHESDSGAIGTDDSLGIVADNPYTRRGR